MAGLTDGGWCPSLEFLERIRTEGFDVGGLRYLKKMLKCLAQQERDCARVTKDSLKSVEKIWNKRKGDPFLDDFGSRTMRGLLRHCQNCEEQFTSGQDGPIALIKQVILESERTLKRLIHSKYDEILTVKIQERNGIIQEIERCKAVYYAACEAVSDDPGTGDSGADAELKQLTDAQRERAREEYKNALKLEQIQIKEFVKVCQDVKTTLMRHELRLFLKKKEVFSQAADWLEKTSLVKSHGGSKNEMVSFLRKQAQTMNAKQFVTWWIKMNCDEIVTSRYQEFFPKDSSVGVNSGDANPDTLPCRCGMTQHIDLPERKRENSDRPPDVIGQSPNTRFEDSSGTPFDFHSSKPGFPGDLTHLKTDDIATCTKSDRSDEEVTRPRPVSKKFRFKAMLNHL